ERLAAARAQAHAGERLRAALEVLAPEEKARVAVEDLRPLAPRVREQPIEDRRARAAAVERAPAVPLVPQLGDQQLEDLLELVLARAGEHQLLEAPEDRRQRIDA